jgi:hypothetical protein
MRAPFVLLLLAVCAPPAAAQPDGEKPSAVFQPDAARAESLVAGSARATPEADVRAVIAQLFDGMRAADPAAARAAFHPDARLASSLGDTTGVQTGDLGSFFDTIGRLPAGTLDERLGDYEVVVDGPLAVAVTPYAFYAGGAFSHCGVNAFTLVEQDGRWWIWNVTDTRRTEGCPAGLGE